MPEACEASHRSVRAAGIVLATIVLLAVGRATTGITPPAASGQDRSATRTWPLPEPPLDLEIVPLDVALDAEGRTYVADGKNNVVLVYDAGGRRSAVWDNPPPVEGAGTACRGFFVPRALAIGHDVPHVYVLWVFYRAIDETGNVKQSEIGTVQVRRPDGHVLRTIDGSFRANDFDVHEASGDLVFAIFGGLMRVDPERPSAPPTRTLLQNVSSQPGTIALTPQGTLALLKRNTHTVHLYDSDGRPLRSLDLGGLPALSVDADALGRIHVLVQEAGTEPARSRVAIRVYSHDGRSLLATHGAPELDAPAPPEGAWAYPLAVHGDAYRFVTATDRFQVHGFDLPSNRTSTVAIGDLGREAFSPARTHLVSCRPYRVVLRPDAEGSLDIVLLLDHSGSIGASELSLVQQTAQRFAEAVDTRRHRLGLVAFTDEARKAVSLTRDTAEILRTIRNLPRGGGTDIALALDTAAGMLAEDARPAMPVILMISDAQHTDFVLGRDPRDVARELRDHGKRIYAIGIGDQVDEALLRDIAGEGRYILDPSSSSLTALLEQMRHWAAGSLAGNLLIQDRMADHVHLLPGSASPPAEEHTDELRWGRSTLPTSGITLTYRIRPETTGQLPTNAFAIATYEDRDGVERTFTFPVPRIEVLSPSPTPRPSPTPTRAATPSPAPLFLPLTLGESCDPSRMRHRRCAGHRRIVQHARVGRSGQCAVEARGGAGGRRRIPRSPRAGRRRSSGDRLLQQRRLVARWPDGGSRHPRRGARRGRARAADAARPRPGGRFRGPPGQRLGRRGPRVGARPPDGRPGQPRACRRRGGSRQRRQVRRDHDLRDRPGHRPRGRCVAANRVHARIPSTCSEDR